MADTATKDAEYYRPRDAEYYRPEDAAKLTGRPLAMVYRYIRKGIIESIDDPEDGRRKLVPWEALGAILNQPRRGYRKRKVQLTRANGTVITKVLPMPINPPAPTE